MRFSTIGIIGAGAWGAALANAAARAGRRVTLWARDAQTAARIREHGEAPRLAGIRLDASIDATTDLERAAGAAALLLVVPAQSLRSVASALRPVLARGTPVIACAKGIERDSRQFMTEVIAEELPEALPAILSGPSFADDVARGLPTAVTLAAAEEALAQDLVQALGSASFRPYHSTDVRGVEIGGAAKNVLAIAVGIAVGRRLGASAAAALTTRGFAELMRFGRAFGGRAETLTGLSGLGDLILTCSSTQSRNYSLGIALGQCPPSAGHTGVSGRLAEGASTAHVLVAMAAEHGIDMPIANAVSAVLSQQISVEAAIDSLLTRPFRAEG